MWEFLRFVGENWREILVLTREHIVIVLAATGYVLGITEGATDISFPAMAERQRKVADLVRTDPAVSYVNSTVGTGGPNTVGNSGRMLIALKPKKERGELRVVLGRLRQIGEWWIAQRRR